MKLSFFFWCLIFCSRAEKWLSWCLFVSWSFLSFFSFLRPTVSLLYNFLFLGLNAFIDWIIVWNFLKKKIIDWNYLKKGGMQIVCVESFVFYWIRLLWFRIQLFFDLLLVSSFSACLKVVSWWFFTKKNGFPGYELYFQWNALEKFAWCWVVNCRNPVKQLHCN